MGAIFSVASSGAGMLTGCAGSLLGTCCGTMVCKACSCACVLPNKAASIFYLVLMTVTVGAALLFGMRGGDIVIGGTTDQDEVNYLEKAREQMIHTATGKDLWDSRFWCAKEHPDGWVICCADVCGGSFAVYRFSFVLCLFFSLMTLLTLGTTRIGAKAHRGFWFAKVALLVGLLVSSLFIDNQDLQNYREVARYLSFAFLLMQLLLVIDFGYTWNETWIGYDDESDSDSMCGWKLAIVVCAFLLYAGSLTGWVLMYAVFGPSECPAQQTLISVTLIACVALTVVSCTRIAPHGTLLTSATVTAYATFLCYSALSSHPDPTCNPQAAHDEGNSPAELILGLVIGSVSMASTAYNATRSKQAMLGSAQGSEMTKPLDAGAGGRDPEAATGAASTDDEEVGPESWWYFHLMMVACSFYMAMLVTDWSSEPARINGAPALDTAGTYSVSLASFWVKALSLIVCLLMYAWTLLAPYLLREHRDFGIEFDF